MAHGLITVEQLTTLVESGEIDTVITAVCDMQGRLVGKRVTGHHFIDHCLDHGTHFCTYLLGTEMDLTTPEGFRDMTWESGYGDYIAQPDWSTLRTIPWLEKTALVLCDAVDEASNDLVEVAPRTILRRQIDRLAELGFSAMMATELEFYTLTQSYQQAHQQGYVNLTANGWFNEDYQLLPATRNEPLYRRLRNAMTAAGVPIEFSKGEAAPGQHEVNIHFNEPLTSADRAALFKHGAKEIADQHSTAITFMAKPYQHRTGSSGHIHVTLWDDDGDVSLFPAEPASREMSDTMRWFVGGLISRAREYSLLIASTVNAYKRFATASWAPVNIVWGRDNRTCGFRVVGAGNALRVENRLPGGDCNPYLAFAAVLAAGIEGIEQRVEPPAEFRGNGYTAQGHPRVPRSLAEAIEEWAGSEAAVAAFGDTVHAHYLTAARIEQDLFDQVVTDWERLRYLERG